MHGTAVTFQWTFLCYGFAKSIQYASPCCMCESLIRTIRTSTHHMAMSHKHATPQTQFATMSSYTLNTIQYISIQILLHCVVNMIWPFCSPTNIFQWQFCKAQGGQSMGNLRYWNLRIEICTTYTFPAHWQTPLYCLLIFQSNVKRCIYLQVRGAPMGVILYCQTTEIKK